MLFLFHNVHFIIFLPTVYDSPLFSFRPCMTETKHCVTKCSVSYIPSGHFGTFYCYFKNGSNFENFTSKIHYKSIIFRIFLKLFEKKQQQIKRCLQRTSHYYLETKLNRMCVMVPSLRSAHLAKP